MKCFVFKLQKMVVARTPQDRPSQLLDGEAGACGITP